MAVSVPKRFARTAPPPAATPNESNDAHRLLLQLLLLLLVPRFSLPCWPPSPLLLSDAMLPELPTLRHNNARNGPDKPPVGDSAFFPALLLLLLLPLLLPSVGGPEFARARSRPASSGCC